MRFMIIVKATADSEDGVMPTEAQMAEMAAFHEELQAAGVLVDGTGLKATAHGWRIDYDGEQRHVTDGPFAETKELVAGYTMIQVKSREEALEWSRRFPNPAVDGGKAQIEVRECFDLEDFEQHAAVERFRQMGMGGA